MKQELEEAVFERIRRWAAPYAGKTPAKYIAGFELPDGRQLAVQRNREAISLWLESDPPAHLTSARRAYAPGDARSSNLAANAPRLAAGCGACYVEVPTLGRLEELLSWYTQPPSAPAVDLPEVGLVVREPWIDLLLDGQKTWEMRSKATTRRGRIALIRKGSGQVEGEARLIEVKGPLSEAELRAGCALHQSPPERIPLILERSYRYAWVVEGALRYAAPVPYRHPPGAVTWVRLGGQPAADAAMLILADPGLVE